MDVRIISSPGLYKTASAPVDTLSDGRRRISFKLSGGSDTARVSLTQAEADALRVALQPTSGAMAPGTPVGYTEGTGKVLVWASSALVLVSNDAASSSQYVKNVTQLRRR